MTNKKKRFARNTQKKIWNFKQKNFQIQFEFYCHFKHTYTQNILMKVKVKKLSFSNLKTSWSFFAKKKAFLISFCFATRIKQKNIFSFNDNLLVSYKETRLWWWWSSSFAKTTFVRKFFTKNKKFLEKRKSKWRKDYLSMIMIMLFSLSPYTHMNFQPEIYITVFFTFTF